MSNSEWIELFRLVPEHEHNKLVIVFQSGMEICVDTLVRFEKQFAVMRGRMAGTIEESRGFFVPYEQMLCLRLERVVKSEELQEIFSNAPFKIDTPATKSERPTDAPIARSSHPTPLAPTDPAAASRLLMEKIKAARAISSSKSQTPTG